MKNLFGYEIIQTLGQGKTGTAYLVKKNNSQFVLKKMNEQTEDPQKTVEIFNGEKYCYERMSKIGKGIPKLFEFDEKNHFLVKEYIQGETAATLATHDAFCKDGLTENHFRQILDMSRRFKKVGIHVDYFPTNFIYTNSGELYCIDYECYDYNSEWDFEHWGIYYWLNKDGMRDHLEKGGTSKLNKPGTFKPFDEPFEELKKRVIELV